MKALKDSGSGAFPTVLLLQVFPFSTVRTVALVPASDRHLGGHLHGELDLVDLGLFVTPVVILLGDLGLAVVEPQPVLGAAPASRAVDEVLVHASVLVSIRRVGIGEQVG